MKKARSQKLKKFNKVLSVLLAAAMVAGSVPDVSLVAHATEAETEAAEETNFLSEENVDTTDSDAADAVSESTSEEVSTAEEQQQPSEEAVPTEEEVSEEAVSTQEASSTEENKESEPTSDAVETESVNVSEDNTAGEEGTTEPNDGAAIEEVEVEESDTFESYSATIKVTADDGDGVEIGYEISTETTLTEASQAFESDTAADGDSATTKRSKKEITVEATNKDSNLFLKASPKTGYEITEIKIGDSSETVAEGNIYNLGKLSEVLTKGATVAVSIKAKLKEYPVTTKVLYTPTIDDAEAETEIETEIEGLDFDFEPSGDDVVIDDEGIRIKHGKDLKLKVKKDDTKVIESVGYQETTTEEASDTAANQTEGVYTVPTSATVNPLTVNAHVKDKTYAVKLYTADGADKVTITEFKNGAADSHKYEDVIEEGKAEKWGADKLAKDKDGVKVVHGDTFAFTFTVQTTPAPTSEGASVAAENDIIPIVKVRDEYIAPVKGDTDDKNVTTYTAEVKVTGDTAIEISQNQEAADYKLTLTETEDSTTLGEITLTGGQYYIKDEATKTYYLDTAEDLKFKVTRDEELLVNIDYKVEVKVGSTSAQEIKLEPAEDGTYTLPKTAITGDVAISLKKVTLTPQEIAIDNQAVSSVNDIQYMANENKDEYAKPTEEGKATGYEEKDFLLKFRVADGYTAVVANGEKPAEDADETVKKAYKTYSAEKTEGIYTCYRIPKADIKKDFKIVISIEAPKATIEYDTKEVTITKATLTGDWGAKDVLSDLNSGYTAAVKGKDDDGKDVIKTPAQSAITVLEGETLTVEAVGNPGYVITGATDNKITLTVKSGGKSTIATTADYTVVLKQGSNTVETVNNIYNVNTGIEYTVALGNGAGASTTVKGLELKAGSKVVGTSTTAKFTVAAENEGKKLTVDVKADVKEKVTGADGKEKEQTVTKVVKSFQINVQKNLTGVTIAGVKNGELSQTIGTTAEYAVNVQPKGAVAELTAEPASSTDKNNIQAEIADGKLKITTKAVKPCTAEVKISLKGSKEALTTVKVNVISPIAGKKPTLKVKYTTDTELMLTLGAAKLSTLGSDGVKYAYHVTAVKGTDSTKGGLGKGADIYIPIDGTTASQDALVGVFKDNTRGKGGVCEFSVVTTLVLVKETGKETVKADVLDETDATVPAAAATKDPYFETKLTLKKGAGTVYTGQQNAAIAVPVFTKEATYIKLTARDITSNVAYSNQAIGTGQDENGYTTYNNFTFENGQLTADIGTGVSLGKHTIEVIAETDNIPNVEGKEVHNMYHRIAVATITVNVVRGIEDLKLQTPEVIYKEAGKAASYTVKPIYNWGNLDSKPKAAKVTGWKIVAPEGEELKPNVRNNITINNSGKITINKNYTIQPGDAFRVYAKANDYAGNIAECYSDPIRITSTIPALTALAVVKNNDDDKIEVVAADGDTVQSSDLDDTWIAPIKKTVVKGDKFSQDEWDDSYALYRDNYTYTTKSKNILVGAWGTIDYVSNTGKVTITVKSNIGGKAVSKNLVFNVGYTTPENLDIEFKKDDEVVRKAGATNTDFSFAGTGAATLTLEVNEAVIGANGKISKYAPLANHANIEVTSDKGGKIIKGYFANNKPFAGSYNEYYKLVVTGRTAKVTLKSNKKVIKTYTVTNTTYSDAKAPTAKITSGNYIANRSDIEQNVEIQFKKLGAADKFAVVEIDETAINAKNSSSYNNLKSVLNGKVIPINGDKIVIPSRVYIAAGSYKLKVTVGTTDIRHNLIPSSKTINVTLKAVAEKPFKPTTSYTITAKDAGLKITGKGDYENFVINEIYNDNVGGKSNNFDQYFKIATRTVEDESGSHEVNTNVLSLTSKAFDKSGALVEELQKGPVTGYIQLQLAANHYTEFKISVKVTTDSKSKQKYTIDKATVLTGTDAVVSLKLGKDIVPVEAVAAATETKLNKNGVTAALDKDAKGAATGNIKLGNLSVKGSNKVTLYVIPKGSYYTAKDNPLTCGIEVAATIDVKDTTAKNKIKLASTKLDIVNYDNTGAQMYSVKVPYSIAVSGSKVTKAEVVLNDKPNKPDKNKAFTIVEKVEKDFAANCFTIQIKKSDVDSTDFGYSTAKKAKSAKVPVKITFASGAEETYSLTLKMPIKADNTYEAALDNIESSDAAIKTAATPKMTFKTFQTDDKNVAVESYTAQELNAIIAATDALKAKLDDVVGNGSDVLVWLNQTAVTYDAKTDTYAGYDKLAGQGNEYEYEAPTAKKDGTITFKVKVYDMSVTKYDAKTQKPTETGAVFTEFAFKMAIPKLGGAKPSDIAEFFTAGGKYTKWGDSSNVASSNPEWYTKDTTQAQIIAKAGEELSAWAAEQTPALDVSNIRLKYEVDSEDESEEGVTTGKLVAFDANGNYGQYSTTYGFSFSTEAVNTLSQAVDAVDTYLTSLAKGSIYISKETTLEDVKALLKAHINNDKIEVLDNKSILDNGQSTDAASISDVAPGKTGMKVRIVLRDTVTGQVAKCNSGSYYEILYLTDVDIKKAYDAVNEALTEEKIIEIIQTAADSDAGLGIDGANVKEQIVAAANDVLADTNVTASTATEGKLDSKYQIAVAKNTDDNSDFFVFEAPEWNEETGSVAITLELQDVTSKKAILPESETITCEITLASDLSIMSLAEAGKAAEDRLKDTAEDTKFVVTNETTEDDIIQEIYKVIDEERFGLTYELIDKVVDDDTVKVNDFTLDPATVKAEGSIKGKIKLTAKYKKDEGTSSAEDYITGYAGGVITFTLTIPKLTQTDKEAAAAVSAYFSEVEDADFAKIKSTSDLLIAINAKLADNYTLEAVTTGDNKLEVKNTAPTTDKDKNPVDGTVVAKGAVNLKKNGHIIRVISVDKSITYEAPKPETSN